MKLRTLINEEYLNEGVVQDLVEKLYNFLQKDLKVEDRPKEEIEAIKSGTADEKDKRKFNEWLKKTWQSNKTFFSNLPRDVIFIMALFPGVSALLDAASVSGLKRDILVPLILSTAFEIRARSKQFIKKQVLKYLEKKRGTKNITK